MKKRDYLGVANNLKVLVYLSYSEKKANYMQMNSTKVSKKCASTPKYLSPNQLTLAGFETPFAQKLTSENRWVKMAQAIPWDKIVGHYDNLFKSVFLFLPEFLGLPAGQGADAGLLGPGG